MLDIIKGDSNKEKSSQSSKNLKFIENIFLSICPNDKTLYDPS